MYRRVLLEHHSWMTDARMNHIYPKFDDPSLNCLRDCFSFSGRIRFNMCISFPTFHLSSSLPFLGPSPFSIHSSRPPLFSTHLCPCHASPIPTIIFPGQTIIFKIFIQNPPSPAQYSSSTASAAADSATLISPPHTPISPSSVSAPSTASLSLLVLLLPPLLFLPLTLCSLPLPQSSPSLPSLPSPQIFPCHYSPQAAPPVNPP
ncbi:hypothetical protein ACMFMG_012191 [Clarireedia jacksonii]